MNTFSQTIAALVAAAWVAPVEWERIRLPKWIAWISCLGWLASAVAVATGLIHQ